ncbi:unnamed protein product [Owenia fusiformis]|uniref:Uncharacterized protein n=1 Tax=Owenia fusiformis TaxID=6347 RepID=A0A8J1Y0M3_OWEFU|nr:unnamed protein product [Owenia fusiformis]
MSLDMENLTPAEYNIEDEAYEPVGVEAYSEAFPPMEAPVPRPVEQAAPSKGSWNVPVKMSSLKSSKVTQVFKVPLEERRYKVNSTGFGEQAEQQSKICQDIMQKTGVSIEMSLAKDLSLTVVITGKMDAVMRARREVVNKLQTQANTTVAIPKEHHRFLLGRDGKKLQQLELETQTKITIPRPEEKSDIVKIIGTKEGIDKAQHEILLISEERSKLAFERLPIPKVYHPFIVGPNNSILKQLREETGASINVPPPSVEKDEIVVSGDKDGVISAKQQIMKVYEEKKRLCQPVSVEVRKSQHKYVIGPRGTNLSEILAATGVSVEVPPPESNSNTITLRGEQDKLGPALTLVYSKANSIVIAEVDAPAWLHRFIIGRKGATVNKITADLPKVHIEFTEGDAKIIVEGPPEQVEEARKALEEITKDLLTRMDFAEIEIDQKYHRHIIGKGGANVGQIKNETGVSIRIPSDTENSKVIRIEGDPSGVKQAKDKLLEMVQRMENERTKDILIEQRFHKNIIGAKGDKIKEIRDKFNQVQVKFPEPGKKTDVVTLLGPKTDVEKCAKYMQNLQQELIAVNYQSEVHIFKQFHKNVIGKGGANIRRIRDDTDTRIDLPSENSDSDVIVITGKKANVDAAKVKIEAIQKELANIKELTIEIPHKFHNTIIGAKGHLIRAIAQECGGVIIRFPPEGSSSDKVVIRGPIEDVERARVELEERAADKKESSHSAEVKAEPNFHKFLIGRGGVNIRKVRDNTGARVVFPSNDDPDKETIVIIGKEDQVAAAKAQLETLIKQLENVAEVEINVDSKYHRHFVARRGEVLRQIEEDFGGVSVSFPRSGVKSDRVVLKGAKNCVEGAKDRILEIVSDLASQVTIECVIEQKYHRTVMGAKGSKVQQITKDHDVGIKFPDRPIPPPAQNGGGDGDVAAESVDGEEPTVNGDSNSVSSEGDVATPRKCDIILITGQKEKCEAASQALKDLVPVTEEVMVPYDFHRFIIGQKGRDVRKMMEEFDVSISIPPAMAKSEVVKVSGAPAAVEKAKAALLEKIEVLEKEREDRELKSFQLDVTVDPIYHPKIIGRRGAVVNKIRTDNDVNIQFPDRGSEKQEVITITGYEENAKAAEADILKIVKDLEDMYSVEVSIDSRVHRRLIGGKGRNIRKIMDDYRVDIKFPPASAADQNIVVVSGAEDDVEDCKDQLLLLEEEYLQDINDSIMMEQYTAPKRQDDKSNKQKQQGYFVAGAPWSSAAPDLDNDEEFPEMSQVAPTKPPVSWGPSRKH